MNEFPDLHARLLEEARNYDPATYHRGLLAPYRDVLLLWRAKFMSYQQIAATLTSHGIRVSAAGVGAFCRHQYTKSDIYRARREIREGPRADPSGRPATPSLPGFTPPPMNSTPNRRGPKIARDNY